MLVLCQAARLPGTGGSRGTVECSIFPGVVGQQGPEWVLRGLGGGPPWSQTTDSSSLPWAPSEQSPEQAVWLEPSSGTFCMHCCPSAQHGFTAALRKHLLRHGKPATLMCLWATRQTQLTLSPVFPAAPPVLLTAASALGGTGGKLMSGQSVDRFLIIRTVH